MKNLEGEIFGKLLVIKRVGVDSWGKVLWRCECECGNKKDIPSSRLLRKDGSRSCGCRGKKHGDTGTPLNRHWQWMRGRCRPRHKRSKNYSDRGIRVCKEWDDFLNFKNWALKNGYKPGLTLDRINNDKGYSPKNCRWVDRKTQAQNTSTNINITFEGKTKCIAEWSRITGFSESTISRRLNEYGWTPKQIFEAPKFARKNYYAND